MTKFVLTEGVRSSLKAPLGTLFRGEGPEIYEEIRRLIALKRPARVVFVGDAVSRRALAVGLRRDVVIIDNKEMRAQTRSFDAPVKRTLCVRNDAGTISLGAWGAVEDAIESADTVVVVDGEEDLLTLVAMAVAPLGSFVVYGQPGEGLVLVEVDEEARKKVSSYLGAMTKIG